MRPLRTWALALDRRSYLIPWRRWGQGFGLCAIALTLVYSSASLAESRMLVIGTKEAPPFSIKYADGSWGGISVELWRGIAENLGITYEFRELDLNQLLAGLEDGSLDVVVGALTVTAEREERFDFTHPYYSSGLGIAVPGRPRGSLLGVLGSFISLPFLRILGALLGVLWIAGALVWVFERRRNPEQFGGSLTSGLGSGFWWSAATMTSVGYGDKTPRTFGGRLVALVWMFVSVFMIAGFTAALAAALTVGQLQSAIQGPVDLPRYVIATAAGSTSESYLTRSGTRFRRFSTIRAGLEAVASGEFEAAVYDAPILRHLAVTQFPGRVRILPDVFEHQDYAIGLPSGSPLRETFNRALLRRIRSPEWPRLLNRYLGD